MSTLDKGYMIPFKSPPTQYEERNNKSARENMKEVRRLVSEMILRGVVQVVKCKPICVSPLGLVEKSLPDGSKKYRLVWDASRHVNQFVQLPHVRLAHLDKALEITKQGDWQIIFDLTSAYYHIKIKESHHKFLGAAIENTDGSKLYFQYTHLPFGLNSAVHAITKIWKPINQYLNKKGLRNTIYIDDGRILVEKEEEIEPTRKLVYDTVAAAGWAIEREKSDKEGEAGRVKKYLGFVIDSEQMQVKATQEKLEKVQMKITQVLTDKEVRVKDLAGLLGLIVSLEHSHDFMARIATRSGYMMIADHTERIGWKGKLILNKETREEIEFFEKNLIAGNGALIKTFQTDIRIDTVMPDACSVKDTIKNHKVCEEIIVSDASEVKAVAYRLTDDEQVVIRYNFDEEEKKWSSTAREALAVLKTLEQFDLKMEQNKNIYWVTDSEVMTQVLKKGSHRLMLQTLVFKIANLCHKLKIRIEPIHLRREDPRIQLADEMSKTPDTDNWSVDESSFQELHEQFNFETDLFADKTNRKTKKFFSLYYNEETLGIDAFSASWNKLGILWICPPVSDLIKVHQRISKSTCKGVVIFPRWITSSFIHLFFDKEGKPNKPYTLVKEWHPYIVQNEGATNTALFGRTNFPFVALAFNF